MCPDDAGTQVLAATRLTTEFATNPIGVGTPNPRLGWRPSVVPSLQSAYEIIVGSDEAAESDGWSSRVVESDQCSAIRYAGPALRSRQTYRWKVRLRDYGGQWGAWSAPATFETAMLDPDDWGAQWIGAGNSRATPAPPDPLLRREFHLPSDVRSARLYVCGLGYAVTDLNGRRVSDAVLDAPVTAYDQRVITTTHDVTDLLRPGTNVLATALGRGFYATRDPERFGWYRAAWSAEPKLIAQLEVDHTDRTRTIVTTDESWQVTDGPTTFDAPFAGESYDARRAVPGWTERAADPSTWRSAAIVTPPTGRLESTPLEPIRVTRQVKPLDVRDHGDGTYLFDFGEHIAGWVRLRARGPAGTTIQLRYGELLGDDDRLAPRGELGTGAHPPLGERFQADEYTLAGNAIEEWEPQFTYKGFRYVEISGLTEPADEQTAVAQVVHSDVGTTSTFTSSEPVYDWVHDAFRTTLLNNLHGLPTDTPAYEKAGWLGDAHVAAEAMLYSLDFARIDDKWLRDIADSQASDGSFPSVAPPPGPSGFGWWGTTPAWTGAYVAHVRRYWEVYGDRSVVDAHYRSARRHVDHLLDISDDGISTEWWGDWGSPGHPGKPPEDNQLTGTAYLYKQLRDVRELAAVLDQDADADRLQRAAQHVAARFNSVFLDRAAGVYRPLDTDEYRQTANVLPLGLGIVPDDVEAAVVTNLIDDVQRRGDHLNTGVLGTSYIFDVLTDHGHGDLAHRIAAQRTTPSYGAWMDTGSTTLWEFWEGRRSRNHYFFGSVVGWLIRRVVGVSPASPGYRLIRICPDARGSLTHAAARLETVRGLVACRWQRRGDELELTAEIPGGAEAEIRLPGVVDRVGPGHHTFTCSV